MLGDHLTCQKEICKRKFAEIKQSIFSEKREVFGGENPTTTTTSTLLWWLLFLPTMKDIYCTSPQYSKITIYGRAGSLLQSMLA